MLSNCSWNQPGRNPYKGTTAEAVARYTDIPAEARRELAARIDSRSADDQVTITRDAVFGKYQYSPQITAMHFGQRTMCDRVDRSGWKSDAREPAAVYCVGDHCLIVPEVCGNISRIRRGAGGATSGTSGTAGEGGAGGPAAHAAPLPMALQPLAAPASPDVVAVADAMAQLPELGGPVGGALADPDAYLMAFPVVSTGMRSAGRLGRGDDALTQPVPVPEPATFGMLVAGLALLFGLAKRRAG
jgi:hypothetical protein